MVRSGQLQRVSRGLFSRTQIHHELGALAPHSDDIAAAVERSIGMPVIPSGAFALNALHLSEQVPAKLEFKTAGPTRTISVGKRQIRLKHAPARRFRARARIVPLVIEALSALGRERVTEDTIRTLRAVVGESDRAVLGKHIGDAPVWMQRHLRQVVAVVETLDTLEKIAGAAKAFDNGEGIPSSEAFKALGERLAAKYPDAKG
jgi:hypothetical protein